MAKKKSMPPWIKDEKDEMMPAAKGKAAKGKKKKMGVKAKKKASY